MRGMKGKGRVKSELVRERGRMEGGRGVAFGTQLLGD
jgi:hypothetical protein